MGLGTLSAVTVQSGALMRAGIIGDGLNDARHLILDENQRIALPTIMPGEIPAEPGIVPLPLAQEGSEVVKDTVIVRGGGGGGMGLGSSEPECPAADAIPDLGTLECETQDGTFGL